MPGFEAREGASTIAQVNGVSSDYFTTFGVQILAGRVLAETDSRNSARVVVVSESLARRYFGSVNSVGRRLGFGRLRNQPAGQAEIVGIARDALYRRSLRDSPPDVIYVPYSQMNEAADTVDFGIRGDIDTEALANAARRTVQAVVPSALAGPSRTLTEQVDEILVLERLLAALGGAFGLLCLALTTIGLYGLLAYSVTRRLAEIGLRIALGAERGRILWLVLRQSVILFVAGTERESLLSIPSNREELIRRYTLSESDLSLVRQHRGAANRLGFAVQLCYMRYPGIVLEPGKEPFALMLSVVAAQLKVEPERWAEYGLRDATRREHLLEIEAVLGFRPFTVQHYRTAIDDLVGLACKRTKALYWPKR